MREQPGQINAQLERSITAGLRYLHSRYFGCKCTGFKIRAKFKNGPALKVVRIIVELVFSVNFDTN